MLTNEERHEVEKVVEESLHWKDSCVEALMVVQRHHGWVSDDHLADVAAVLKMTPAELDGIVTFYSRIFRKPVGRHVILLCDSVSCWITGHDQLLSRLRERLQVDQGETTSDGSYTLLPTSCLGACDHAPAMLVDERFYGDLDPDRIGRILDSQENEES